MGGKSKRRNAALNRRTKKSGLPPGTLVHIGEKREQAVLITYMDYDENSFQEKQGATVEECFAFKDTQTVTWINIDGIDDIPIIEKIGKAYDLHPLILEDIVTAGQRPKFDNYDKYIYIVLKMLTYNYANHAIESEQISIVFGSNFVISFQENVGDIFNPIRDRIRLAKGRIRKMGSDYLAYSLIDTVVDNYFVILETVGERLEEVEEALVDRPGQETLHRIHGLKRQMLYFRKALWPLREIIGALSRGESALIRRSTVVYLRDVYDHTIQAIETLETYRDIVSGFLDIYLSSVSNRLNEIMKVLALISTIFMPLTFIAGVYGMNFKYMPELEWPWGYPAVLLLMLAVSRLMIRFFRTRQWM